MKPIREWSVFAQVLLALVAFVFGVPIALVLIAIALTQISGAEVALAAIVIGAVLLFGKHVDRLELWVRRRTYGRARR